MSGTPSAERAEGCAPASTQEGMRLMPGHLIRSTPGLPLDLSEIERFALSQRILTLEAILAIAGFASTVGWPLSAFLDAQFGWRATCLIWAALHIVIGLPLNRLLIPRAPPPAA